MFSPIPNALLGCILSTYHSNCISNGYSNRPHEILFGNGSAHDSEVSKGCLLEHVGEKANHSHIGASFFLELLVILIPRCHIGAAFSTDSLLYPILAYQSPISVPQIAAIFRNFDRSCEGMRARSVSATEVMECNKIRRPLGPRSRAHVRGGSGQYAESVNDTKFLDTAGSA